jgi:hypothetical protein
VLGFRNGKMQLSRIYFGSREHAWKKYIAYALRNEKTIDRGVLIITHVGLSRRDLLKIQEEVSVHVSFEKIYFHKASPAISTTTGPCTFELFFWRTDNSR